MRKHVSLKPRCQGCGFDVEDCECDINYRENQLYLRDPEYRRLIQETQKKQETK